MVKKVKTYLNNAEAIEDEDRLVEMANQCESSKSLENEFNFTFGFFSSYNN